METLVDIFLESTNNFKDKIAIQMVSEEKKETIFYFQLRQNAEKIASRLINSGIGKNLPLVFYPRTVLNGFMLILLF